MNAHFIHHMGDVSIFELMTSLVGSSKTLKDHTMQKSLITMALEKSLQRSVQG